MATIKLDRTNEYTNRFRKFRVYIDGIKAGEISNGESKSFEVTAGKHEVVCKIDWCSSPTISMEVPEGEVKTLKVGGFKHGNWILTFSFITIFLLPLIKSQVPEFKYLYYLIIPIGGLLIYYITIGRKKYLRLKEV